MRVNILLVKSNLIIENLEKTVSSFFKIYEEVPDDKEQKQDLLRAIILFACSGIDAVLKQLINDTLEEVIKHDAGALDQFKSFVEKKINDKGVTNSKLLAELFTCDAPKDVLISVLKRDLTNNSLQSAEELFKAAAYFNIPTQSLNLPPERLKNIFGIRNKITHEMDIDLSSSTFTRGSRTKEEVEKISDEIVCLAKTFVNLIEEKLQSTTVMEEMEIMSI